MKFCLISPKEFVVYFKCQTLVFYYISHFLYELQVFRILKMTNKGLLMIKAQGIKRPNRLISVERILGIIFLGVVLTIMLPVRDFQARVSGNQGTMVAISVVVLILIMWVAKSFISVEDAKGLQRDNKWTILMASLVLFGVQLFIGYNIMFRSGWDVASVHYSSLYASIGDSEGMRTMADYLSYYPNNLFLVFIYSNIYKLNILLGSPVSNHLLLLVFFQSVIYAITGALTYFCSEYIVGPTMSWLVYIVFVILVGTSAWVVVPYSDSTGLFFPVLILYLYICLEKSKNMRKKLALLSLISFLSYIGYKIKPTIAIVFIAIVGIGFLKFIHDKKKSIAFYLTCMIIIVVTMIGSKAVSDAAISSLGYEINQDMSFGIEHWILLGSNDRTYGSYNQEDFDYSASFSNSKERNTQDLKEAISRYKSRGILGNIDFWRIKMWREFTDATFGWGGTGFYMEVYPERIPFVSVLLRSLYYDEFSEGVWLFPYYAHFKQIIWYIMLLLISCFAFFLPMKSIGDSESVIALTLVGLVLYLLIFESHPRYLFIFVPYMIIMSIKSFKELLLHL